MPKPALAFALLALALLPLGCAAAYTEIPLSLEQTAVLEPVQVFVAAFNVGDTTRMLSVCAAEMSILDEFPPFAWQGPGACAQWLEDYDTNARTEGLTEGAVVLGAVRHVDIVGDRAYVVSGVAFTWRRRGEPQEETGATFTCALARGVAGWQITGWAWSKG